MKVVTLSDYVHVGLWLLDKTVFQWCRRRGCRECKRTQNRHQKLFNRGALQFCRGAFRLCGGAWHYKINQNSTYL